MCVACSKKQKVGIILRLLTKSHDLPCHVPGIYTSPSVSSYVVSLGIIHHTLRYTGSSLSHGPFI